MCILIASTKQTDGIKMKTISQISQEITTEITPMSDGRSSINVQHIGGESKFAIYNSVRAGEFASIMANSLVSRIANRMEEI